MSVPYLNEFGDVFGGLEMGGAGATVLSIVLVIVIITACIASLIGIITYILESIAFFTIAKRRGLKAPGLAWVPVADTWLIGSIADQYDRKASGRDRGFRKRLLSFTIVTLLLSPVVGLLSTGLSVGGVLDIPNFSIEASTGVLITIVVLSLVLLVISVLLAVNTYIALYKVYRSCKPGAATLLTVLSIFFNIIIPFALFALRKKDGGFEEIRDREMNAQAAQGGEA